MHRRFRFLTPLVVMLLLSLYPATVLAEGNGPSEQAATQARLVVFEAFMRPG